MKKISIFFKWLHDRINVHNYWYQEGKIWKSAAMWGESIQVPNTPVVIKTFGHKVTKKRCGFCGITVWSNNPKAICGNLSCWMGDNKGRRSNHGAIR
jgi:hypothetical protein